MAKGKDKDNAKNVTSEVVVVTPTEESLRVVCDFLAGETVGNNLEASMSNRLHVIADEIFSNIIKYGGATEVKITFQKRNSAVTLKFEDDGQEFDLTKAPQPNTTLPVENREEGGLGIFAVLRLADKTHYERRNGKNILILTIKTN